MSKMMDNLARVQEEQPEAIQPKPSLFVVKEQPVASMIATQAPPSRRKTVAIWGTAALLIAALGASYFFTQKAPDAQPLADSARVAPSASDAPSQIRAGQLSQALVTLDGELRQNPSRASSLTNRAYVLKELGKPAEAEAALRALLLSRPKDVVVLNNLGALLLRSGRIQEAEAALRDAVSIDPSSFEARLNLAGVLERKRDWPGALKLFEEVLERGDAGAHAALIRERIRRLRSLAIASLAPKEKL
jgi:Tfp pilus assembly protein PilF